MSDFKPPYPFAAPVELLIPSYTSAKGVESKSYPSTGLRINCSWKTYGGTETDIDGVFAVLKTATVVTWYRPDIKSDCRLRLMQTGEEYEIIGEPENIDMRCQFLRLKVKAVTGGA